MRPTLWLPLTLLLCLSSFALSQTPEDTANDPAVEPALAEKTFQVHDNLHWQLLLSEPLVTQPLQTSFDSHGRLWLIEYRQYPNPEGLRVLSKDRHWRVVYDSIPKPPGAGGLVGRDRISVHEDKDQDGTYESHHVFVDGLNIATAVVPVANGAWVLNPPYLLFYQDADNDLQADAAPQIHLEGFGLEDTHSVVNSLTMGPDGWLYGAQGSTVSAAIRPYGSAEKPIQSLGQAIWRYHPQTHQYEIFAEGGGNAFGVAFDDQGEIFSGHNGGDTRGFHYYQGGYYRKGFSKHGSLSNPHSYGYLLPMQHDPIQRFTHAMLLTESTSLAQTLPRSMLAIDPLHGKLIQTELEPIGSTYKTKDIADTVKSTDKWFRPVAISDGPNGAAFVCDWYDSVVAHLYAFEGRIDRDRGRVYRLTPHDPKDANTSKAWDNQALHGQSDDAIQTLLTELNHPYRWHRWNARNLLSTHPLRANAIPKLLEQLTAPYSQQNAVAQLEALWTLHALGAIPDTIPHQLQPATLTSETNSAISPKSLLQHPNPAVRNWTIRLTCDDRQLTPESLDALSDLASRETNPHTLCQIACSIRRLEPLATMRVAQRLLERPIGNDDLFFPLLLWWAIEHHATELQPIQQLLIDNPVLWEHELARKTLFPNLVRRWASIGTDPAYRATASIFQAIAKLEAPKKQEAITACQEAFEAAFVGKSLKGVPDLLIESMASLGTPPLTLRVRRGDPAAFAQAAQSLSDPSTPEVTRIQLARLAGELKDAPQYPELLEALLQVANDSNAKTPLRSSAISALANFDLPKVPESIIQWWSKLPPELYPAAGTVLASRPSGATRWLDAVAAGTVSAEQLPPEAIRTMRLHPNEQLQRSLNEAYPQFASIDLATATQKTKELASRVLEGNGDPYRGKKLYRELCGRCHQLFDDGGRVGPDLTGYQRDQLETLLRNIVGPSLEIREGYQMVRILTSDSLVLTGFVESEQPDQIILRNTDGQSVTLERSDIEQLEPQVLSLMPEGLLDKLDDTALRDLMAYLRSSQPLNDGT